MTIAEEIAKSIWRELGRDVLKKGVSVLVTESIRARIEIAKKRKIRKDQYEFLQWKKTQNALDKEVSEDETEG